MDSLEDDGDEELLRGYVIQIDEIDEPNNNNNNEDTQEDSDMMANQNNSNGDESDSGPKKKSKKKSKKGKKKKKDKKKKEKKNKSDKGDNVVKINYLITENEKKYTLQNTIEFLLKSNIPYSNKANLSKYIHTAMMVIEEMILKRLNAINKDNDIIGSDKEGEEEDMDIDHSSDGDTLNKLKAFSSKLLYFHMNYRKSIHKKFLLGLWWVRCKVDFLINDLEGGFDMKLYKKTLKKMRELKLLTGSSVRIEKLGMKEMWRYIQILAFNFNNISYSKELDYYIYCLYICCAKFCCLILPQDVSNFAPFIRKSASISSPFSVNKGSTVIHLINENYLFNTEVIFYDMYRRLVRYRILTIDPVINAHNPKAYTTHGFTLLNNIPYFKHTKNSNKNNKGASDGDLPKKSEVLNAIDNLSIKFISCADCIRLHKWLMTLHQSIFHDTITEKFRKDVYDNYLIISEKDRYENEYPDGLATSYTVIAYFRSDFIDKKEDEMGEIPVDHLLLRRPDELRYCLYKNLAIKNLSNVNEKDVRADRVLSTNQDFGLACMIVIDYYFQKEYGGVYTFWDFIVRTNSFSMGKLDASIIDESKQFPYIVQGFNKYGILYKASYCEMPNFETCLLYWLLLACEDSPCKSVFPHCHTNNRDVHNLLQLYHLMFPDNEAIYENLAKDLTSKKYLDGSDIQLPDYYEEAKTAIATKKMPTVVSTKDKKISIAIF